VITHLGAVFLLLFSLCQAQEACSAEPNELRLSMNALKAADVALKQFEKDQPKADPKKFHVSVEEFDTHFEINFLPDTDPIREGVENNTAYITMPNPRGNKYGIAIGYEVAKSNGKVLRTFYSK
jgi:hypothetical protein